MKHKPRKKSPLLEKHPELRKYPDWVLRKMPDWMWEWRLAEPQPTRKPQTLAERIAEAMKESNDGVGRLDVPAKRVGAVCDYLDAERNAGRIGGYLRQMNADPFKLKARWERIAVFPVGWRNPAIPLRVRFFDDAKDDEAEEKASRYVEEQERKGFFARIASPSGDWKAEPVASISKQTECPLWTVEVWKPGDYLKRLATSFSEIELLDAMQKLLAAARRAQIDFERRQEAGLAAKGARKNNTADEQQKLYRQLREKYPVEKVSKDWLMREKICKTENGKPRRATGWKIRTVKRNLKGMK